MRFLVVPEDSRNDALLLEPVLRALLTDLGFARPKLKACRDPLMGGIDQALNLARLEAVVARYVGMVDTFILCVDRDADPNRRRRLDAIEAHFGSRTRFIAVEAWQEVETWALAGCDLPAGWRWQDVRNARDVKEDYFAPFAASRGLASEPGGGRRTLGSEAARRIDRIRQLCPEDFGGLAHRLSELRTLR